MYRIILLLSKLSLPQVAYFQPLINNEPPFPDLFHREFQVVRCPVVNLEAVLRAEGPSTKRAHEIFLAKMNMVDMSTHVGLEIMFLAAHDTEPAIARDLL